MMTTLPAAPPVMPPAAGWRPSPVRGSSLATLVRAQGTWVSGADGRWLVDMVNGYGAVFLGHGAPPVVAAAHRQLDHLWTVGRLPTDVLEEAVAAVCKILPAGLGLAGLYSTGMEAIEFALRLAMQHTGRSELAAFGRSMHGKSALTAALAWPYSALRIGGLHTLPAPGTLDEHVLLGALEDVLASGCVAALLIEPLQGSNGGHALSPYALAQALALCRRYGTLCLFDEILTGLYRTGTRFVADFAAEPPDVLVFGKSMANGLPCSAVAARHDLPVTAAALPGSTFAGNAMVAAVAAATLKCLAARDVVAEIAAIDGCVRENLTPLVEAGIVLRGRGALWLLGLGSATAAERAEQNLRDEGVLVGTNSAYLRLLPSLALELPLLKWVCERTVQACLQAMEAAP